MIFFQDFPGPEILKKKNPGLSRTFQEAWEPCIDWVMRTALTGLDVGLHWTDGSQLSDLDYADDIVLLETSRDRMQQLTETVETEGKKIALQMNVKKCKT